MAGITGSQDYWIVGSRFYFEPNLAGTATRSGEMIDLGTVDTISPQISTNIAELKDSESGVIILLDQGLVSIDETYSITVKNFNFRNLQILFAGKSQTESQAANIQPASMVLSSEELSKTPSGITGNIIKPTGGYLLLQLRSSTGEAIRNFTTSTNFTLTANIQATGGIVAGLTKDTHWTWWDAPKGIIRIIFLPSVASGYVGMQVEGGVITSYPAAGFTLTCGTSNNLGYSTGRVIYPQSVTLSDLTGNAHIYWSRNNGADVSARTFKCQIQPAGSSLTSEDYSSWTMTVTALASGTTSEIAGRYTNIKWNNTTTGNNIGFLPDGSPAYNENFFGEGGGTTGTDYDKTPDFYGVDEKLGGAFNPTGTTP